MAEIITNIAKEKGYDVNDVSNAQEGISKNGKKFRFGTLGAELTTEEKDRAAQTLAELKDDGEMTVQGRITVNWEPSYIRGPFNPTMGDGSGAYAKGIDGWGINDNEGALYYEYRLYITNYKGWYFDFWDATGDRYRLTTPRNGDHYLDYNSDNATIVGLD